jgi:hypothetical protein
LEIVVSQVTLQNGQQMWIPDDYLQAQAAQQAEAQGPVTGTKWFGWRDLGAGVLGVLGPVKGPGLSAMACKKFLSNESTPGARRTARLVATGMGALQGLAAGMIWGAMAGPAGAVLGVPVGIALGVIEANVVFSATKARVIERGYKNTQQQVVAQRYAQPQVFEQPTLQPEPTPVARPMPRQAARQAPPPPPPPFLAMNVAAEPPANPPQPARPKRQYL